MSSEVPLPTVVLTLPTLVPSGQSPAWAPASEHFGTAERLPTAPTGRESLRLLMSSWPSARLITMCEVVFAPACSGSEPAESIAGAKGIGSGQPSG